MEAYEGEADRLHSETIALAAERDAALEEVARLRELLLKALDLVHFASPKQYRLIKAEMGEQ